MTRQDNQQLLARPETYCRECGDAAVGSPRECCIARVRETMATMYRIGTEAIADRTRLRGALTYIEGTAFAGEASPNARDFQRIVRAAHVALNADQEPTR